MKLPIYIVTLLTIATFNSALVQAQNTVNTTPSTAPSGVLSVQEISRLAQESDAKKDYLNAAKYYRQLSELDAKNVNHPYNAACAYALATKTDLAFSWLERAIKAGYVDIAHLKKDTDLDSLHLDARWPDLLVQLELRIKRDASLYNSEVWKIAYADQFTEDQRVAGLSKLWSEVKFGFVFTDTLKDLDWDAVYIRYLPKVRAATNTLQYYRILMEMTALLKDGHSRVIPPKDLLESHFAQTLLKTAMIENRVIITEVNDETLRQQGLLVGMEIVSVNALPVKQYAQEQLMPLISASTKQDMDRRIYGSQFLMGALDEAIQLGTIDEQGKKNNFTIFRVNNATRAKAGAAKPVAAFEWRMLEGQIAYVALNSFGNDTAAREYLAAFPEIAKAKSIIFDLRKNGGGNGGVGYRILSTLSPKNFEVSASSTREYKPTLRAWGQAEGVFNFDSRPVSADQAHQFTGKVVVLSAAQTYSAAEDFLVAFDTMKRGMIIGEPSGGSTGQPLVINLPGEGMATIVSKNDSYPNGKAFVGVGVQPHRLVMPTVSDFRSGKDKVLQAAIEEVRK
ncbi:MAG: hypothetical protein K2P84_10285 [Undibacterium sp.]|nr:hypothetical protein [Undibacterium sp.]